MTFVANIVHSFVSDTLVDPLQHVDVFIDVNVGGPPMSDSKEDLAEYDLRDLGLSARVQQPFVVEFGFNLGLTVDGEEDLIDSLHEEGVLFLRDCVLGRVLLWHRPQQLPVNCCHLLPTGVVQDLLLFGFENSCEELEL